MVPHGNQIVGTRWWRDPLTLTPFVMAVMINAGAWAYAVLRIQPTDVPVFLHYNIYFGVDLIGPWYRLFLLPASGTVFIILNVLLAWLTFRRGPIVGRTLAGITVWLQVVVGVALYLIIRQNS